MFGELLAERVGFRPVLGNAGLPAFLGEGGDFGWNPRGRLFFRSRERETEGGEQTVESQPFGGGGGGMPGGGGGIPASAAFTGFV